MSISLITDSNGQTWICFDLQQPTKPQPKQRKKPVRKFSFELKIRTGENDQGEDNTYYDLDEADRFIEDYTIALKEYNYVDCECIVHHIDRPYWDYVELDGVLPYKRETKKMNDIFERMKSLNLPLYSYPNED